MTQHLMRPTAFKRIAFFILTDAAATMATLYWAYLLRFNFVVPDNFLTPFWHIYITIALLKVFAITQFNGYSFVWRFFGIFEAKKLVLAHFVAYGSFFGIFLLFESFFSPFPRSIILIDMSLSLLLLGALRISKRIMIEQANTSYAPALILGMNSKSANIIKSAMNNEIPYYPVAIVLLPHEDQAMRNRYMHNIKVYSYDELEHLVITHAIKAAIITAQLPQNELQTLYETLTQLNILEIKNVKLLGDRHERLEDLSIEDLLARHPKDLDSSAIGAFIKNKTILITGAGGSIGSEIAKQCHRFGAKKLILLDHSEFNLYSIGEALDDAVLTLQSVIDVEALHHLFTTYPIEIVIHAAAYKHVPICEANISAALINNIQGTKNIIDTAIAHKVSKVVIISTDKAVRPTNVMGATKRIGELYAQNVDAQATEIVSVRFGNVLGSSGSVIPKFKSQIENGGPVTVTHPDMTRYFMLIPEACQLVLQAAAIAKGGELFILDMGKPVQIIDLAKQMIRLYGKEDDIDIVFSGLRPGEKLYEELLIDENEKKTQYESIFIAKQTPYPIAQLQQEIALLLTCNDPLAQLKAIVPEFEHRP